VDERGEGVHTLFVSQNDFLSSWIAKSDYIIFSKPSRFI